MRLLPFSPEVISSVETAAETKVETEAEAEVDTEVESEAETEVETEAETMGELTETDEAVVSYATSGSCGDGLTWNLYEDGQLIISGEGDMYSWTDAAEVPWYDLADSIETVVICDGVTSIGSCAFRYISTLTAVELGKDVASIGDYAFDYCEDLESVNLPVGLSTIGVYAFGYCRNLVTVKIPFGVYYIGDYAFYKCTRLTYLTLPATLTEIGDGVFGNCYCLANVKLPVSIESIGDGAFAGCVMLRELAIPDSVTSIGAGAFMECENFSKIIIPASIESTGDNAFALCHEDLTIYGYCDTFAEEYAIEKDITFIDIDEYEGDIAIGCHFDGSVKKGTAKIDGVLDEAYRYSFVLSDLGTADNAYGTDWWYTCTANAYFMYDDTYLYICAEVRDDDVLTKGEAFATGYNPYANDNIEFRLSLDGSTDTVKVAVDAYGYACYGLAAHYDKLDYSAIKYATTYTDTSYVVELAIPCTKGSLNMIDAGELGIAYQLNDINADGKHVNHTTSFFGEAVKVPVFVALSDEYAIPSEAPDTEGDYGIDLEYDSSKGEVKLSSDTADKGDKVIFPVTPYDGYEVNSIKVVRNATGAKISVSVIYVSTAGITYYCFTMPADDVTLTVEFDANDITDHINDDTVNSVDLAIIQRYIGEWSGYAGLDLSRFDLNGDGSVNAADAAILSRHLAGWEGYEDILTKETHPTFTDVYTTDWYYDAVDYVSSVGMMNGMSPNIFDPNSHPTRAMAVTILYRLAKCPTSTATIPYTDVPNNQWYTESVRWAAASGLLINTASGDTFGPNSYVTREQLADMIYRYELYKDEGNVSITTDSIGGLADSDSVSVWAENAVNWCLENGILEKLVVNGKLSPKVDVTRAVLAQVLYNYRDFN